MADPKEPKRDESFKVIDRRLFNAEGEVRDEIVRQERLKEDMKPAPPVTPPAADERPRFSNPRSGKESPHTATAEALKPSRGFQMLINFVAQNAAMLLGAYPDPRTGEPVLDLEGARELIDMLDALREASRNNLAQEDERLLLDVLGSLKLSFMEMTKAAAKAASPANVKVRP